jgi:hypothetical protein
MIKVKASFAGMVLQSILSKHQHFGCSEAAPIFSFIAARVGFISSTEFKMLRVNYNPVTSISDLRPSPPVTVAYVFTKSVVL